MNHAAILEFCGLKAQAHRLRETTTDHFIKEARMKENLQGLVDILDVLEPFGYSRRTALEDFLSDQHLPLRRKVYTEPLELRQENNAMLARDRGKPANGVVLDEDGMVWRSYRNGREQRVAGHQALGEIMRNVA
mgnify:CR=1 FL=1